MWRNAPWHPNKRLLRRLIYQLAICHLSLKWLLIISWRPETSPRVLSFHPKIPTISKRWQLARKFCGKVSRKFTRKFLNSYWICFHISHCYKIPLRNWFPIQSIPTLILKLCYASTHATEYKNIYGSPGDWETCVMLYRFIFTKIILCC